MYKHLLIIINVLFEWKWKYLQLTVNKLLRVDLAAWWWCVIISLIHVIDRSSPALIASYLNSRWPWMTWRVGQMWHNFHSTEWDGIRGRTVFICNSRHSQISAGIPNVKIGKCKHNSLPFAQPRHSLYLNGKLYFYFGGIKFIVTHYEKNQCFIHSFKLKIPLIRSFIKF